MKRITDIEAPCPKCTWKGIVGDTEPDKAGELTCPECGAIIVVTVSIPDRD